MKTALDSSVILDVVTNDPQWADASERAIKEAYSLGQLVVCECVIAEITPAFALGDLETFLLDWKIRHIPSTLESAAAAGEMSDGIGIKADKRFDQTQRTKPAA